MDSVGCERDGRGLDGEDWGVGGECTVTGRVSSPTCTMAWSSFILDFPALIVLQIQTRNINTHSTTKINASEYFQSLVNPSCNVMYVDVCTHDCGVKYENIKTCFSIITSTSGLSFVKVPK